MFHFFLLHRPDESHSEAWKTFSQALYGVVSGKQARILNTFIHQSSQEKNRHKITDDWRKLNLYDQFRCQAHSKYILGDDGVPYTPTVVSHLVAVVGLCTDNPKDF